MEKSFDCHSCGFKSCREMAIAIARGINEKENCHQYMMKSIRNELPFYIMHNIIHCKTVVVYTSSRTTITAIFTVQYIKNSWKPPVYDEIYT